MTKIDTKPLDSEELVKSKLQELIDFRKDDQDIRELGFNFLKAQGVLVLIQNINF